MNGAHDTGGMMGYGPVVPEINEPVFHHKWEARAFALIRATSVHSDWNWDQDRSACENRSPDEYLRLSYYEIWLASFDQMLAEKRLLERAADPSLKIKPEKVREELRRVSNYERSISAPAKYAIGDYVRTRNIHPAGHTRLPRYLRGHAGEIIELHGAHVFPDSNAHGRGEDPQWLYTVRFTAQEVWGNGSSDKIQANLWEPYLEAL
jgi:nitrile hydratase beta subunit